MIACKWNLILNCQNKPKSVLIQNKIEVTRTQVNMFDPILYTCTCAVFYEKKLVAKKNNLTRFISLNWKEKEKKTTLNYMILYNIVFLNLISQTKEFFFKESNDFIFSNFCLFLIKFEYNWILCIYYWKEAMKRTPQK